MSQRDDLCLHCSLAAKPDKKGIQHHDYNVEHGRKRLTAKICNFKNSKADGIFSNDSLPICRQ
jgi:hypothetical protein